MTLMAILKKIFHVLFVGLLGFFTAISLIAITASLTATNRETIKSLPDEAGIYPKISQQLLTLTEHGDEGKDNQTIDQTLDDSPLDKEALKSVIASVYTADYWQGKYEKFVDDVYDWLEGQAPELKFSIAFNDKNDELAGALEKELTKQLSTFPTCKSYTNTKDFDPLSASCLPLGVSAKQAAQQFTNELKGEDSFLADAVVTQDTLNLDEEAQINAPNTYNALQALPWILGPLLAILAIAAILTDKSFLHGLKKIGQTLFGIGIVTWIGFFLSNKLATSFELRPPDGGDVNPDAFNDIAQPLVRTVFKDITSTGMQVSLIVVIVGVLAWLGAFIWHKTHHNKEAEAIAKRAMEQKAKEDPKLPKPAELKKDNKK